MRTIWAFAVATAVTVAGLNPKLAISAVLDWTPENAAAKTTATLDTIVGENVSEDAANFATLGDWPDFWSDPPVDPLVAQPNSRAPTNQVDSAVRGETPNGPFESFVLIAPTKSFIYQLVSIGLELHQRGHRVTFVSHGGLRQKLSSQFGTVGRNFRNQSFEIIEVGIDSEDLFNKPASFVVPATNEASGRNYDNIDTIPSPSLLEARETSWVSRWETLGRLVLHQLRRTVRRVHESLKYSSVLTWDALNRLSHRLPGGNRHTPVHRGTRDEIGAAMAKYDEAFDAILSPFEELLKVQQSAGSFFDSAHSRLNHCFNPRNESNFDNLGKVVACWPQFSSSLFVIPGPWDVPIKFCQKHNLPHVLLLTTPLFANLYSYPIYAPPLYTNRITSPSRILRWSRRPPTFFHRLNNMLRSIGQLLNGPLVPNISPNLYRLKPALRLVLSIPSLLPLRFHPPLTVFTGPVVSQRRQRRDSLTTTIRAALDARRHRNAIYISLGTVTRIEPSDLNKLVEAFLPTIQDDWTVVWAMSSKLQAEITTENARLIAAAAPNFIIESWVETPAILSHPGVKLFVSHCGANGYHEALASGVPVLGIPLHGDQPFNCAAAEANIGNVACFGIEETSALTLRKFAREILNKPVSHIQIQNATKMKFAISKAYNGMENVIKWLETAAALKGNFQFLRTPPEDLGILRGYNLDIALVVLSITVLLLTGLALVVSNSLSRSVVLRPQQPPMPRKKKHYKAF